MKFELYRSLTLRGWRWFWRLKATNGETIAHGEGYHNKGDAVHAVGLVAALPPDTPIVVSP